MSSISCKYDFGNMDNNKSLFDSDKCIIGVSQFDESSILITDDSKVVKYELSNRKIIQEWRTVTGAKNVSCAAVHKGDRFYVAVDVNTIARWKNTNMYIDQNSKTFKVIKPCLGLIKCTHHLFVMHLDGTLSLFSDPQKSWCHKLSPNIEIIAFNQLQNGQSNCDIFLVVSDKKDVKVVKYEVQVLDQQVNVTMDTVSGCHSLLTKFSLKKPMKVLYLDDIQCVVCGTLKDYKTEGVYMLNERIGSIKCCMDFKSKSLGNVVQMMRLQNSILLVTTKHILELDLAYKSPLLCNLIAEDMDEDFVDHTDMEFEVFQNENSFYKICENLKGWMSSKGINDCNETDLQEFFTSSSECRLNCGAGTSLSTEEKLLLIPLFCRHSFYLNAKEFVEMITFILSLDGEATYKQKVPTLMKMVLESTLPDDMLKNLHLMEFEHVKILMEHLYNELLADELETEKVIDWIDLMIDSHYLKTTIFKDWEVVRLIKQHLDALCEEAKDVGEKRSAEKLKFTKAAKRSKDRRGYYIEMFRL